MESVKLSQHVAAGSQLLLLFDHLTKQVGADRRKNKTQAVQGVSNGYLNRVMMSHASSLNQDVRKLLSGEGHRKVNHNHEEDDERLESAGAANSDVIAIHDAVRNEIPHCHQLEEALNQQDDGRDKRKDRHKAVKKPCQDP